MPIIEIFLIKKLLRGSIILFGLILFVQCSSNDRYYYAYYEDKDSIKPYRYSMLLIKKDSIYRVEYSYVFTAQGYFRGWASEVFRVKKNELSKIYKEKRRKIEKPYLTLLKDTCINYKFDENDHNARNCFLGIDYVFIKNKKIKCYKFEKDIYMIDGTSSTVFYDQNFIKVKEIINTPGKYYKMERIDEKDCPIDFTIPSNWRDL